MTAQYNKKKRKKTAKNFERNMYFFEIMDRIGKESLDQQFDCSRSLTTACGLPE